MRYVGKLELKKSSRDKYKHRGGGKGRNVEKNEKEVKFKIYDEGGRETMEYESNYM